MIKKYEKPRKKKLLGQHFLRKQSVVDHMIEKVQITPKTSILEIGCGDGFLTRSILEQTKCKHLLVYEIDPEWVGFVRKNIEDDRLNVKLQNVLDVDLQTLVPEKPWVLLANLPYQVTFPILFLLQQNKDVFQEGVVMVQEEVAQKLVATRGKPYSASTLFLQHHCKFELMEKVEPEAFVPPPKVFSRLVYFKPKREVLEVGNEEEFWKFVKMCFKHPRQTLKNNLKSTDYDFEKLFEDQLRMRAQQMSFKDFIKMWKLLNR